MQKEIQDLVFEKDKIRRIYSEDDQCWYFSVIDIIKILTNQSNFQSSRNYWKVLKNRLKKEGSQVVTKCNRFKLISEDKKLRMTDCADVETLFRLIQSVPSKKAEPIKLWLAKVGKERIQEISDPEISLNRTREYWKDLGRSGKWIQQRMMGQETRNKLTDYWKSSGVNEHDEFATLTNIIHKEWSNLSIREHKNLKGLANQNLRDHMSEAELIFTALAEFSTRQIAESENSRGFIENIIPAKLGGRVAKNARIELELKSGKKVITNSNLLSKKNQENLN
jgi:hypothetical protein